jgi:hypothetical protein
MTVTGNTRQVQLAVGAVLLAGKACVAGVSATVTRCEESNYYKLQQTRQDCQGRKNDRGQQGFGYGCQWGMCTIGGTYLVGGHRGSMATQVQAAIGGGCGAAAAPEAEQQRSSTGRGRSGWYAKRASGGGRADRDGDARCKRPGARTAGQSRAGLGMASKATYRTGLDRIGHALLVCTCTFSRKGPGPWLLPVRRHRVAINNNNTYILEVNQSHRRKRASGAPYKRARECSGKACRRCALPCFACLSG